ncbi:hypothetical protein OG840_52220 [Streptomyces sp. NBC_01764]|uniref:hypothetical protein n=1 Tax=Streptomyces sp. NBC_01764 TaxID=2975935 RepID=UPI0022546D21|nr:hypothetical protein [Streptomyces sp. NBC_01764]MCX4409901.1 hypothetical protein [Streptomyces sp. NBC_01764]
MTAPTAHAAGRFEIAGKKAARVGFGAMRLTGLGIWGEPNDRAERIRVRTSRTKARSPRSASPR